MRRIVWSCAVLATAWCGPLSNAMPMHQFFGNGGALSLQMYSQKESPALNATIDYRWVGASSQTGMQMAESRNRDGRFPKFIGTPTIIERKPSAVCGVSIKNVEWRNRWSPKDLHEDEKKGQKIGVFFRYVPQLVGDHTEVSYLPGHVCWIADFNQKKSNQPSGLIDFPLNLSGYEPGAYEVSCEFFLAEYNRTGFGPFVLSKRGEKIGRCTIPFSIVGMDWEAKNDEELRQQYKVIGGMNMLQLRKADFEPTVTHENGETTRIKKQPEKSATRSLDVTVEVHKLQAPLELAPFCGEAAMLVSESLQDGKINTDGSTELPSDATVFPLKDGQGSKTLTITNGKQMHLRVWSRATDGKWYVRKTGALRGAFAKDEVLPEDGDLSVTVPLYKNMGGK